MGSLNIKSLIFIAIILSSFAFAYDGNIDLQCQEKPNFNIGEKEYCLGIIPQSFAVQDFKCISYISYVGEILQTNPQYQQKTQSFFSILSTDSCYVGDIP